MENKAESLFFHHQDKGCELKQIETIKSNRKSRGPIVLVHQFCTTHKVECCRCGWQWQHHQFREKLRNTK